MEQNKGQISVTYYKECCEVMEKVREHRQGTTLDRHLRKYECLCQQNKGGHSNIGGCSNKQQHHTCMAQSTALTSDVVSSSPPTIPPVLAAPAARTTVATTTTTTVQSKWVKNLLKAPLTEAQVSLLDHGPHFAITPRNLPLWGVHHCSGTSMFEPGATECRRAEGRNKGSFETCT